MKKSKNKQTGIVLVLLGAFMIYWAQDHSPQADFGKIIGNQLSGSYTMSEPWYYISLVVGIIVLAFGIRKFTNGK